VTGARVVVVDLDGTLTPGDSMWALLRRSVRHRPGRTGHLVLSLPAVARRARRDPDGAKERLLVAMLAGLDLDGATALADRVAGGLRLSPQVRAAVDEHLAAGDVVWLASASIDPVVAAVARRVGAHGAVATTLADADGRLTGRYQGRNCKGEEKLRRLDEVLPGGWRERAVAYSDSTADRPLMEAVAEARWVRRGKVRSGSTDGVRR
jgi:phosphatidylglycerophosphatase C